MSTLCKVHLKPKKGDDVTEVVDEVDEKDKSYMTTQSDVQCDVHNQKRGCGRPK